MTAKNKAEDSPVLVNIAVVDAAANLKAFIRMHESFLGSIDIALRKVETVRNCNNNAEKLGKLILAGLKLPRRAMLKSAALWSTNP